MNGCNQMNVGVCDTAEGYIPITFGVVRRIPSYPRKIAFSFLKNNGNNSKM